MATSPRNDSVASESRAETAQGVEQAQELLTATAKNARATLGTMQTSAMQIGKTYIEASMKTVSFAQDGMSAAAKHLSRIAQIRDAKEASDFQAEFVRSRLAAFQDYLKDIGSLAQAAIATATPER